MHLHLKFLKMEGCGAGKAILEKFFPPHEKIKKQKKEKKHGKNFYRKSACGDRPLFTGG